MYRSVDYREKTMVCAGEKDSYYAVNNFMSTHAIEQFRAGSQAKEIYLCRIRGKSFHETPRMHSRSRNPKFCIVYWILGLWGWVSGLRSRRGSRVPSGSLQSRSTPAQRSGGRKGADVLQRRELVAQEYDHSIGSAVFVADGLSSVCAGRGRCVLDPFGRRLHLLVAYGFFRLQLHRTAGTAGL